MPVRGDTLIDLGNGSTPVTFGFGGNDEVVPKVVNATFDGTGAGGPFLPCLVITGPSGAEIARIPASQVAAGASAEVSWFPRVGGGGSGASTGGLQFGGIPIPYTYGATNVGGYLQVEARDKQAVWGVEFLCVSGAGGFHVQTEDAAGVIELDAHGANSGISLTTNNDSTFILGPGAGSLIVNFVAGQGRYQWVANTRLGFFGAVPISKPAVTGSRGGNAALASLLTQLVNLGLITNSTSP